MSSSEEITRKAKSNLAIAFACLPKERKRDMITFYAFCRVIDDLADDLDIPLADRERGLSEWREGITHGFKNPTELQQELMELLPRYSIPKQPFLDLIEGCASDLNPQTFQTWDDLKTYTYRVASCVGVISTRIFGCTHPDSEKYAVSLGHALQLTNILRDVGEDLENGGRIYLPIAELAQFNYSEQELKNRVYNNAFKSMMFFQAQRAERLYTEAVNYIPQEDRKALKSAEAMRKIYYELLKKMRAGEFQVFSHRYSVSKAKKLTILLTSLIR